MWVEITLFLLFPLIVGFIAQMFFERIGAVWAASSLMLSLMIVDSVMAGLLRLVWASPDRIKAAGEALKTMNALPVTGVERIQFVIGTAGFSALIVVAVLATLPARKPRP